MSSFFENNAPSLNFGLITNLCQTQKQFDEFNDAEVIESNSDMTNAHSEFVSLISEFDKAFNAYTFLQTHKVDQGLAIYLNDSFALEDITGLPKECLYKGDLNVCTEICMEGLGTYLMGIIKKIVEFFKKLYETVIRFLGIKSFRQRKMGADLERIKHGIEDLSNADFNARIKQNIRCNTITMKVSELNRLLEDCNTTYHLLNSHKDVSDVNEMISATSGMLTKFGYKTTDGYKVEEESGLPYTVLEANQTLNIETSFGIRDKASVVQLINNVIRVLDSTIDVQRWYPMNLKKYATRAMQVKIDPSNPETIELQKESVRKLSDEQKCQAYFCRFIVLYLAVAELLCVRTIATTGSIIAK